MVRGPHNRYILVESSTETRFWGWYVVQGTREKRFTQIDRVLEPDLFKHLKMTSDQEEEPWPRMTNFANRQWTNSWSYNRNLLTCMVAKQDNLPALKPKHRFGSLEQETPYEITSVFPSTTQWAGICFLIVPFRTLRRSGAFICRGAGVQCMCSCIWLWRNSWQFIGKPNPWTACCASANCGLDVVLCDWHLPNKWGVVLSCPLDLTLSSAKGHGTWWWTNRWNATACDAWILEYARDSRSSLLKRFPTSFDCEPPFALKPLLNGDLICRTQCSINGHDALEDIFRTMKQWGHSLPVQYATKCCTERSADWGRFESKDHFFSTTERVNHLQALTQIAMLPFSLHQEAKHLLLDGIEIGSD